MFILQKIFARKVLVWLLAIMLIATMAPMAAFASNDPGAPVEVKLLAGRDYITINGEAVTVQPPFVEKGTTLVPLSVITRAFGAKLQLQDNKIITLTYNDKKVVVTIGSQDVLVNEEIKTVAVAPVIQKSTTMVPVRVIVEAFGAAIAIDAATKEVTITGVRAGAAQGGNTIDSDQGKTKVGDSYHKWTMNYPPGLVLTEQMDDGSYAKWTDATSGAVVIVTADHVGEELTVEEIRDKIFNWFESDEMTLDKRTINVDGLSVEKMVTRTRNDGMVYEYRAVQQGDTLYTVIAGTEGRGISATAPLQPLLDSFRPSFDKSDTAVKDITKVINGQITIIDEDYGLTMKLPTGWYRNRLSTNPSFFSEEASIVFNISSVTGDDTLDKWTERRKAAILEDYKSDYIRNVSISTLKLKDGNANVLNFEITLDKKTWVTVHNVFLISGPYRYEWSYAYKSAVKIKQKAQFERIMKTVEIDTELVEDSFGIIEDDADNMDRSKRITKKSNKYNYSIELPAFWTGLENNFENEIVFYAMDSGSMIIWSLQNETRSEMVSFMQSSYAQGNLSITSNTTVSVGNTIATRLVVPQLVDGLPGAEHVYIFEHKGNAIVVVFTVYDANATDATLKRLEEVIASIKLL